MPLLLIRHGHSAHPAERLLLDRDTMARWLAWRDRAGIAEADRPPAALVNAVAHAGIIASSDMPRAIESARRLTGGTREVMIIPAFREIPLPLPAWFPLRAPLAMWTMLIDLAWIIGVWRGRRVPAEVRRRAWEASEWCREACAMAGVVAVVTHGAFRRVLAQRLEAEGWRRHGGRRSYAHWSAWAFEPPVADGAARPTGRGT